MPRISASEKKEQTEEPATTAHTSEAEPVAEPQPMEVNEEPEEEMSLQEFMRLVIQQNKGLREEVKRGLRKTKEELQKSNTDMERNINRRMDQYNELVKQQIEETREQIQATNDALHQFREEVTNQINNVEDNSRIRVEILQHENQEKLEQVKNHITNQVEQINHEVCTIKNQIMENKTQIEEIQRREINNIKEELEVLRDRTTRYATCSRESDRDVVKFKEYRRNPMEFLDRINEWKRRTRERKWTAIRTFLDECFRDIHDNWWIVVRNDVTNYEEFTTIFKAKYWSEAVQNIVRDNLCNGRFDARRGQTPTTYFLGKVGLARHLEPVIPEECLITKLSYHFEEGIARARLCGQVKTISNMEALLESYEREEYYKNSRRKSDQPLVKEEQQRERPRVNNIVANRNNQPRNNDSNNRNRDQYRNGSFDSRNNNYNQYTGRYRRRSVNNGRDNRPYNNENRDWRNMPRSRSQEERHNGREENRRGYPNLNTNQEGSATTQPEVRAEN